MPLDMSGMCAFCGTGLTKRPAQQKADILYGLAAADAAVVTSDTEYATAECESCGGFADLLTHAATGVPGAKALCVVCWEPCACHRVLNVAASVASGRL